MRSTTTVVARTDLGVVLYEPTEARPYYRLSYRDGRGKRQQPSAGRDYSQAMSRMAEVDRQLARALAPKGHRLLKDLRKACLADHKSEWGNRHYRDTKRYLKAAMRGFKTFTCDDLTREDVTKMLASARTPSMHTHYRAAVSKMLTWGYEEEWLSKPPALLIRKPRKTAKSSAAETETHGTSRLYVDKKDIPRPKDCRRLATAAFDVGGEQAWLMTAVAASCGLRPSELYAVRVGDLDFRKGAISVERQLVQGSGLKREEEPPKWGRVRETILPRDTVWGEPLRARLRRFVDGRPADALVFTAPRGGWMNPSNVSRKWLNKARRQAGGDWIERWVWGSMRHTFATHLINDGNEIADVARLCGHRDPSVTLAIYTNPSSGSVARVNKRSEKKGRRKKKG